MLSISSIHPKLQMIYESDWLLYAQEQAKYLHFMGVATT